MGGKNNKNLSEKTFEDMTWIYKTNYTSNESEVKKINERGKVWY